MTNERQPSVPIEETSREPILLPGSAAARFADLTERLKKLLEQENALLEERKIRETKCFQAEKARLSKEYQVALQALHSDPAALGAEGSDVRLKLREVAQDFDKVLKKHGRILLRMKTIAEGVINAITTEADRQGGIIKSYSQKASMVASKGCKPVPIAYHEVI